MIYETWINIIKERSDLTSRLTHLTRSEPGKNNAFDVLNKILHDKCIYGSTTKSGYIVGEDTAVCFQDVPLYCIAENIIYSNTVSNENGNLRYEGFGIRINKQHAYMKGAREVIYGKTDELKKILPQSEYWRIVNHNLDGCNYLIDWTHEREWRIKGDYPFQYSDIEVIVNTNHDYKKFISYWMDKDPELLKQINGIICLDTCVK